ncbi:MAG: hypothetical protein JW940_22875 [Polyangiaceae bacterium]|nr:hypothetical protein [Polyangiaceae bacterium]
MLRWSTQDYASLPQLTRGANCEGELRAPANSLGVTGDGKTIVSAVGNSVEISDAQSGQVQVVLPADAQGSPVRSVAISPNEPVAAAASGTRVRRWHLPEGAELSALVTGSSSEQVDSLVFSADGRWLFGAGRRGNLSVWSLPRGSLELTLRWANETSAFALAPSGLMEWLGQNKASATCRLGPRLYAADLCEERYAFTGLVGDIFAHRVSAMDGGGN